MFRFCSPRVVFHNLYKLVIGRPCGLLQNRKKRLTLTGFLLWKTQTYDLRMVDPIAMS